MKHAYLIMAHNEFTILEKLIKMLDYENNDIYVHVDKKVKDFSQEHFLGMVQKAHLVFTERISVFWGGVSQIETELLLLKVATKSYHDYYHLLSGVDLPIKSHEYIEEFFENHKGTEFVGFDRVACAERSFENRVKYYHIVSNSIKHKIIRKIVSRINAASIRIQKLVKTNRIKKLDIYFMKGSCWFDITHDFACYIIEAMKKPNNRIYKFGVCVDEVFVQTILYNSEFLSKNSDFTLRFIDWHRHQSSPEILTMGDHWEQIISSDKLYARKFSTKVDCKIIDKVYERFSE